MSSLWTRAGLTWREIGLRLWRNLWEDEVLGRCAELAYFFLFSIFPMLLFLTTLLGYLAREDTILRHDLFWYISRLSPSRDVTALIDGTLNEISAGRSGGKLSLGLLAALWVASNGMIAVSRTLNRAYGLKETRPWWQRRVIAVLLTVCFAVLIVVALTLIFYGTEIADEAAARFGIGWFLFLVWHLVRWPVVAVFLVIPFDLVYNFAPNLPDSPRRQWGTPGAVTAVALFLGASVGFRLYLGYFRSFTTTYGGLGAVILLLVWFYLTAFSVIMGGEVNSEIAREATRTLEART